MSAVCLLTLVVVGVLLPGHLVVLLDLERDRRRGRRRQRWDAGRFGDE